MSIYILLQSSDKLNPHSTGYGDGSGGCQDVVQMLKTFYCAVRWRLSILYLDALQSKRQDEQGSQKLTWRAFGPFHLSICKYLVDEGFIVMELFITNEDCTWYSLWYSFILVITFFMDFCFSLCESSFTGNHEAPQITNSSSVSYTNLYWSCKVIRLLLN